MQSLVILGANGFLGNILIGRLGASIPIKAVIRDKSRTKKPEQKNVTWVEADILIPSSLNNIIQNGDVVINLAYIASGSDIKNLQLIDNIINACMNKKASRLLHCSTAVVVGSTLKTKITEDETCYPLSSYEKNKLMLEKSLLSIPSKILDVGILRPTAIIGPGGRNLLKFVKSYKDSTRFINYIRSCLFSYRPMHLVPVNDVADALIHLAFYPSNLNRNIFIISADDDINNNFNRVEKILMDSLGLKPYFIPVIPLPLFILSFLLWIKNRSATNMKRIYIYEKIRLTGFKRRDTLKKAIYEFSKNYRLQ